MILSGTQNAFGMERGEYNTPSNELKAQDDLLKQLAEKDLKIHRQYMLLQRCEERIDELTDELRRLRKLREDEHEGTESESSDEDNEMHKAKKNVMLLKMKCQS